MKMVLVLHLRSLANLKSQTEFNIYEQRITPSLFLAERAVQKMVGGYMQNKITTFLSRYRITPQSSTGEAPSVLLMNILLRSKFDLLKPSVKDRVVCAQDKQQTNMPRTVRLNKVIPYS